MIQFAVKNIDRCPCISQFLQRSSGKPCQESAISTRQQNESVGMSNIREKFFDVTFLIDSINIILSSLNYSEM